MELIEEKQLNIIADQLSSKLSEKYNYLFLDIDETIITNDGICDASILRYANLLKDKKWHISVATGRSICESRAVLSQMVPNMPILCCYSLMILYKNTDRSAYGKVLKQ